MIEVHAQHLVALICLANRYLLLQLAQVLVVVLVLASGPAIVLHSLLVKQLYIEEEGPVQLASRLSNSSGSVGSNSAASPCP